jgi:hypothetical protein
MMNVKSVDISDYEKDCSAALSISSSIRAAGFWSGNYFRDIGGIPDRELWKDFKNSWDALDLDKFMGDGGKYRARRFSEFVYDGRTGELNALPHRPFFQDKKINALNGGTDRAFSPVTPFIAFHPLIREMLRYYTKIFLEISGIERWRFYLHQVRVSATPNMKGLPSPEGIHKDGVTFSTLFCVERNNVIGAENIIYDNDRLPLAQHTLEEVSDCIIFNDSAVYHYVTPMTVAEGAGVAKRDMLFIEFIGL